MFSKCQEWLCAAVKRLSCRAGLAYCRHLSTVRTHLSALVNHTIVAPDAPSDAYKGLTADAWQTFLQDCSVSIAGARRHRDTSTLTLVLPVPPDTLSHPYPSPDNHAAHPICQ